MAFSHPLIDIAFLVIVAGLWAMILYQLLFAFLGIAFHRRAAAEARSHPPLADDDLPPVSILIPAHNEELVIADTVAALQRFDYPSQKTEILVVNDGSTDRTAHIVERLRVEDSRVRLCNVPDEEAAQGKGHALNVGMKQARHGIIAVYDADNTPEPQSLRLLVSTLLRDPGAVSAFGKFRTRNRHANYLTRFINLETLAFQFMIQAGRYLLFKLAILPGTNFVIYKKALIESGGWDPEALTEDTELSIRIYANGGRIRFVPDAVTWEEEPPRWGVWLRQRTRWVRGNFYVLRKFLTASIRSGKYALAAELLHLFLLYYFFLGSILLSHLCFALSALGIIAVLSPGPYFAVWVCAFLLFIAQIMLVCSHEHEATPRNLLVATLMYFTYCQAWIVVVFRALYQDHFQGGKVKWEKTRRFAAEPQAGAGDTAK
jgi:cellulose synthase/poly-beta-1,6-N-acetylglucosamine synthase-like glycosyltransferase